MNIPRYLTPQEREAYRIGYERGRQEGLKKASLLIQLVAFRTVTILRRVFSRTAKKLLS